MSNYAKSYQCIRCEDCLHPKQALTHVHASEARFSVPSLIFLGGTPILFGLNLQAQEAELNLSFLKVMEEFGFKVS